jgi:dipeptidyl aminopeptidase/acylaminoacyl peptidase
MRSSDVFYKWRDSRWVRTRQTPVAEESGSRGAARLPAGFEVKLYESMNDPPVMRASEGDKSLVLTDADPALQGVWRAPAQLIEWPDAGGGASKGWLMLPRGATGAERLPLVIQATSDPSDVFRPDGASDSGFAAQSLVAQGFAVLVADFYDEIVFMTPKEGALHVQRLDAMVDALVARGIVDPTRVGLVGFSRTGYLTYYIITHPGKTKLAAAAVFDSITASYGEYVLSAGLGDIRISAEYERQYGGRTFWHNKQAWLDAPAFNVERVETPTLFSSVSAWSMLETLGAFRYTRRPIEYLYYPNASHVLQRPRQREAAMHATIDWMTFWLQNRELEGPGKGDRFERWRQIRAAWQAAQKAEAERSGKENAAD